MSKLVYGVGVNDLGPVKIDGQRLKSYTIWRAMLQRCYSALDQAKHPTYIGCTVCDDWLRLSAFHVWYSNNYRDGYDLDKDILTQGNKLYSPDTCRMVPRRINLLLTDRKRFRSPLGIGVARLGGRSKKYQASLCSGGGSRRRIGLYESAAEATEAYKVAKKAYVKQVALEAFLANEIKSDVYLALVRREF